MGKFTLILLFFGIAQVVKSQTDNIKLDSLKKWDYFFMGSFNVTQGKSVNWAEGSIDNFSALTNFSSKINYKYKNIKWDNSLDFKLGFVKTESIDLHKNDDKILISSNYGKKIKNNFYYVGVVSYSSQFFKGFNYPNDSVIISDFLSPAYIYFSLGFDYKLKNKFDLLFSPLTSKSTIVANPKVDETKYGLESGTAVKKEIGSYINFKMHLKLDENVFMDNKLELFSNYFHNPQNIDINFESKLFLKVNSYLSTTINFNIIYDDDIDIPIYQKVNGKKEILKYSKRLQFKELISVGFLYKISNNGK